MPSYVTVPRPLSLGNRCPITDTAEVFDSDTAPGAFGLLDEVLTDAVVYIALETLLPARKLLEPTLSAASANRLQDSATLFVPLSFGVDVRPAMLFAVRVRSNVFDAEIHPERFVHVFGRKISCVGFFDIAGRQQVERPAVIYEVALTLLILHQAALALSHRNRNTLTSAERPDAHLTFVKVIGKHPTIVGKPTANREAIPRVRVGLAGIGDLANRPDGYLRREVEAFSGVVVDELVDAVLTKRIGFPRLATNPVARLVGTLQRLEQLRVLLLRGQQFDLGSQSHFKYRIHSHGVKSSLQGAKARIVEPLLRAPKRTVSVAFANLKPFCEA